MQVCDGEDDCPAAGDSSDIGEEEDGEGPIFHFLRPWSDHCLALSLSHYMFCKLNRKLYKIYQTCCMDLQSCFRDLSSCYTYFSPSIKADQAEIGPNFTTETSASVVQLSNTQFVKNPNLS